MLIVFVCPVWKEKIKSSKQGVSYIFYFALEIMNDGEKIGDVCMGMTLHPFQKGTSHPDL